MLLRRRITDAIESGGAVVFIIALVCGALVVIGGISEIFILAERASGLEASRAAAQAAARAGYERDVETADRVTCGRYFQTFGAINDCVRFIERDDEPPSQ